MPPPKDLPAAAAAVAPTEPPEVDRLFDVRELTTLLLKAANIHHGMYELAAQFNLTIGVFGIPPHPPMPGTIVALAGAGLRPCSPESPLAVDAAVANPAPAMAVKAAIPRARKTQAK